MDGQRKRPKILIADDDPLQVTILSGILGDREYELESSDNGGNAVEKAKTFLPDLILLNSVLPGMDVYEMTRRLKGEPETCIIPIVLLFPLNRQSDKEKGHNAGVDDFLGKPVDRIELLARVQSLVKLKKLQDRVRSNNERVPFVSPLISETANTKKSLIFIIEDDVKTQSGYELLLRSKGYDTLVSRDGGNALDLAVKNHPDLILLDLSISHIDGFELLAGLKINPELKEIPVIISSIISHMETRIQAIDAGADDYLIKPVNPSEMLSRINSTLRRSGVRKRLKSDMDSLFEQSVMDPLTGLYNRRYLKTVIDNDVAAAKRYNRGFFVVMIDIDDFKIINDTLGHLAGDGVLKALGNILRVRLRSCDIAARYGGDEFVVRLTDNNLNGVTVFAERMRASVETYKFPAVGDRKITVSIGVAEFGPQDTSMESVINKADEALYAAKQAGKNRVK